MPSLGSVLRRFSMPTATRCGSKAQTQMEDISGAEK
jgi:hypothetical protein